MKVAIFCKKPFQQSETFITRHICELAPGNTVIICYHELVVIQEKIPTLSISLKKRDSIPWYLRRPFGGWLLLYRGQNEIFDDLDISRLTNFLKSNEVRVILAEYGPLGCVIQPVAKTLGIAVYVYFRGYDASHLIKNWRYRYSYRKLIPKCNGIICVSQFIANNLRCIGVKHPNTHIIPSGVNIDFFIPDKEKDLNLIIAVGRFTFKKGPKYTIEAFSVVAKRNPYIRLEMIGDGELLSECMYLAERLGLSERIIFHGVKDHCFVQECMSKAAIFVQHSVTTVSGDTEGLPSAIQEAMSCGTPVVSTKHAGIPEAVINGKTGYLVDEYDIYGMADAIDKLISDCFLLKKMSIAARERAIDLFSTTKLLNKTREVIFNKKMLC